MTVNLYAGVYSMMAAAAGAPETPHAAAAHADDPFAGETVLSADELREQRGGFFVTDEGTDVGGFLLHFGAQLSEFTINTALSAADPASNSENFTTTISLDPNATDVRINNTLDDVVIQRRLAVDVTIPNFTERATSLAATNAVSTIRVETHLLDAAGF